MPSKPSNSTRPVNGNSSSYGSRTWKTTTSLPPKRKCWIPSSTFCSSSKKSLMMMTMPLRRIWRAMSWIAVAQNEVGQAGGHHFAVVQLGQLAGAVLHRFAAVEQEVSGVVGFLFVLLDVVTVGAAEDIPVQVARVVAVGVFAVLGELDRKAPIGRFVLAGHVTLDDEARVEAKRFGPRDGDGVKKGGEFRCCHVRRPQPNLAPRAAGSQGLKARHSIAQGEALGRPSSK